MLTMDETLAAIKALDTDADILRRACVAIAFPARAENPELTPGQIAGDILRQYAKVVGDERHKLVEALSIALGSYAAYACKPGHEFSLMNAVVAAIYDQFFKILDKKVARMAKDDPAAAVTHMLTVIEGFAKAQEDK